MALFFIGLFVGGFLGYWMHGRFTVNVSKNKPKPEENKTKTVIALTNGIFVLL